MPKNLITLVSSTVVALAALALLNSASNLITAAPASEDDVPPL